MTTTTETETVHTILSLGIKKRAGHNQVMEADTKRTRGSTAASGRYAVVALQGFIRAYCMANESHGDYLAERGR